MILNDNTAIDVLNYIDGCIVVSSSLRPTGYLFEPASERPFSQRMHFSEVREINSQSGVFRDGFLRFEAKVAEEIYKELGIHDWESIMDNDDIEDIILRPTKEGLEKIIGVRSISLFERVRGVLIQLVNSRQHDISMRVQDVIEARYKELYSNKLKTEIIVRKTASEENVENILSIRKALEEEIKEDLKKQILAENAELEEKLRAELKREILAELKEQHNVDPVQDSEQKDGIKKVGRPAKL